MQRCFYSDLHRLDLRRQEWSLLSDTDSKTDPKAPPVGMFGHQIAWHKDKLYVVGSDRGKFYSMNYRDKVKPLWAQNHDK